MNFCLSSNSFQDNNYTIEDIYKKIENLDQIYKKAKISKDKIYRNDNTLYFIDIFRGLELYKFFTDPSIEKYYKTKLRILIDQHSLPLNDTEIIEEIGLHEITDDLICTLDQLVHFYFELIKTIHDEDHFAEMIKLHFLNLEFQDKINNSIKTLKGGGLKYFSEDIINSLLCLENEFKEILKDNHNDVRKSLVKLSTLIGLDTTIEGNAERKPDFTFEFLTDDKQKVNICCEPHVKLSNSSKKGDNTFYFNRLHFHVGRDEIKNGNILIGSIGYHL